MGKKIVLNVKVLGGLKITCGEIEFPQERKRSAQVELLLIYLIFNRNASINNPQLIDLLWPEGDADKPEGALRNLVYRARKEMKEFFDVDKSIKSKGRSYYWNLEIECRLDYEAVLRLCRRIEQEEDLYRKYERCLEMINKYSGDVLPEFNYSDWASDINNMLERTCLEVILNTLKELANNNLYEQVLQICNHQNSQKIMDTRLYEMKLYAYYKTGKTDLALSFYRQIVDYYYSKYGIEVSPRLKEIYQTILDTSPAEQVDVEELEKNLTVDDNNNNTFYCDFDVFKNIYQINIRSARRSMKVRILALLTIVDTSNRLDEKAISQEANILKNIIANSLRKNDVYSKFNMSQYSLILASPNLDGAKIAVDRIINRFNDKKKHQEVILTNDLKIIR